jgi:hypothetical protein
MIWIGGLLLAAAIYVVGPDQFLDVCLALIDAVDAAFRQLVQNLGAQVYGVIRALAIALYVVFAVLAFLAAQRGQRGVWALIVVTFTFLFLVWRPYDAYPASVSRWIIAFGLVLFASILMTQRLMAPPRRDVPPWPPRMPPGPPA